MQYYDIVDNCWVTIEQGMPYEEVRFVPYTEIYHHVYSWMRMIGHSDRHSPAAVADYVIGLSKQQLVDVCCQIFNLKCDKCGKLWVEHDFGVPEPYCP